MSSHFRVPDRTDLMNETLRTLVDRFDPRVLELGRREARVRLEGPGVGEWDAVLRDGAATLEPSDGKRPDAIISADGGTWHQLAHDLRGGMDAFRAGRLTVRRDLHLGVGFLAATAGTDGDEAALRFTSVETEIGEISTMQAGSGSP